MPKIARIALVLLIVGMYLFIPITAFASDTQLVVITASPFLGNGTCVYDFTVVVISDYEIQLDWIPGNGTGTYIVGAYGRWPVDATDGFVVYNGSGNHTSHWLDVDIRILSDLGLYYKAYNDLGGGVYSPCFASGSVTGGTGMTVLSTGVTLIGTIILAFLALGCMVSGYHFKNSLFMWGATIFWIAVIGFSYAQSSVTGDTFYIIAGASGMMALLSVAFIVGGMGKDKPGLDETALQKYQKTESVKTETMDDFKKRMGLKGKRSLNKYPWERS